MTKIKDFETIAEAKEYGTTLPNKYASELVRVGNKPFMLCQTNLAYEDMFDDIALNLFKAFGVILPETQNISFLTRKEIEDKTDYAALRDLIIEAFEKTAGYSFLDAFDEY